MPDKMMVMAMMTMMLVDHAAVPKMHLARVSPITRTRTGLIISNANRTRGRVKETDRGREREGLARVLYLHKGLQEIQLPLLTGYFA